MGLRPRVGTATLGLVVLLTASCGSTSDSGRVVTPDVVGESVEYARGALAAVGLVGEVVETDSGEAAGQVTGQVPEPGTEVAVGSSVVIKVTAVATTTTTTPMATTTTTTPMATTTTRSVEWGVVQAYLEQFATGTEAGFFAAAELASSWAETFAKAHAGMMRDSGGTVAIDSVNGEATVCFTYSGWPWDGYSWGYEASSDRIPDNCRVFTDFKTLNGQVASFSVDGLGVDRMVRVLGWWDCVYTGTQDCNRGLPSTDHKNLYVWGRHAFLTPERALILVFEVMAGGGDFTLFDDSFITMPDGSHQYTSRCWSVDNGDLHISPWDVSVHGGSTAHVACVFKGFEDQRTSTEQPFTLVGYWGDSQLEIFRNWPLPQLG